MRRIMALLLVIGLLIPLCMISPAADSTSEMKTDPMIDTENKTTFLFKEKIEEKYADWINQFPNYAQLEVYNELFYHYDSDGEIDWALIRYRIGKPQGPLSISVDFGSVIVRISDIENNLLGMSVYDVKKDEFIPITVGDIYDTKPFDYSMYDGFVEALVGLAKDKSDLGGNVSIILCGDIDNDQAITILDATHIQRYLTGLSDTGMLYDLIIADYDKDGVRSILDATAIQRHLVNL